MTREQVGIILRTFESPFFSRLIGSIVKNLKLVNIDASVQSSSGTGKGEAEALNALTAAGCQGIMILSEALNDRQLSKLMARQGNIVLLGRPVRNQQHRCVYFDEEYGGRLAAQHLVTRGHRNISMVTGPMNRFDSRARAKGFIEELERQRISLKPELIIESDFNEEGGAASMSQLIKNKNRPTAVFFQNDNMAIGALPVCQELGVSVPEDISIMGYDDILMSQHYLPALTTVHSPLLQSGALAAKLMAAVIRNPSELENEPNLQTCIPPYIVERDSVADISSQSISDENVDVTLSARERDCLQWTALGKTAWEISVILGINETTVVFHLRNAIRKLDAANRVHAVVKAIKASIISV